MNTGAGYHSNQDPDLFLCFSYLTSKDPFILLRKEMDTSEIPHIIVIIPAAAQQYSALWVFSENIVLQF